MHESIVALTLFFGVFLALISVLQFFSEKISFPYTVALLVSGLIGQYVANLIGFEEHISLSPEFIFYILLPLLLFDSAIRMNFHQFQLHFRTITFLTTFGLLISVAVVGVLMAAFLNIPLAYGILFGAIISATDPIAVVSIFKSLRAPKRLSLIAEGESMFNDATAVIAFRVLSAMIIGSTIFEPTHLVFTLWNFTYVFIGSIILGSLAGYLATRLVKKIQNDHIIETTITVALALSVFIVAEHYFHVSGVIATVMAGIIFGNIGRTSISREVVHFVDKLWEYIAFLCISLVFFFAAYTLDIDFFFEKPFQLLVVVLTTIFARAVSVYTSTFITNKSKLFRKEPNIPMSWQHILNWGGLRGVIPLVLVYSLPDNFSFKGELINFTLASFLFTLFVNGTTIKALLIKLGVHLPKKEEEIIKEEERIFEAEGARKKLLELSDAEFDAKIKKRLEEKLLQEERKHRNILLRLSNSKEFFRSLKYQALEIERNKLNSLFEEGHINENVYYMFETQLDLQSDSLEFPEVLAGRGVKRGGFLPSNKRFHERLARLENLSVEYPILAKLSEVPKEVLIKDRLSLLKTRIASSNAVVEYLNRIKKMFTKNHDALKSIQVIEDEYKEYIVLNKNQIDKLSKEFPVIAKEYQQEFVYTFVKV